jgi:hypothetical protein
MRMGVHHIHPISPCPDKLHHTQVAFHGVTHGPWRNPQPVAQQRAHWRTLVQHLRRPARDNTMKAPTGDGRDSEQQICRRQRTVGTSVLPRKARFEAERTEAKPRFARKRAHRRTDVGKAFRILQDRPGVKGVHLRAGGGSQPLERVHRWSRAVQLCKVR